MNNLTKEQLLNIIAAADEVLTALDGTNEDLHRDDSAKMCAAWDNLNDKAAPPDVVKRLAETALVSLVGQQPEPPKDLIMQVNRLLSALKSVRPQHCLIDSVSDYMRRKGYWRVEHCLRDAEPDNLDAKRIAFIASVADDMAPQQVEALARAGRVDHE